MNAKQDNPKGNELVKRLLAARPYGTATIAFYCEWEDQSRVPKTVKFPDGLERKVGYMRDGILMFRDRFSAGYARVTDDLRQPVQSMVVYYKTLDPKVCN